MLVIFVAMITCAMASPLVPMPEEGISNASTSKATLQLVQSKSKSKVIDCGADGNIGTPWTCIGCPPGKKDQPCEAKKLGKKEMVSGICADEYTCVEKKAELAEVAEKAEETDAALPPLPTAPAMLVEKAQGTEPCTEDEHTQLCANLGPKGCLDTEDCGSDVSQCQELAEAGACDHTWLKQCCRVSCGLCTPKEEEVLDCGTDGNINTPWTCTGCPPGNKDKPCEAKRLGKAEMVRGICADDFTCVKEAACPAAETMTKEAGCCPNDQVYDDGKKCCPAGTKSSAGGCTGLPPPPPPPPPAKLAEVAEKAEETVIDCGADGNIGTPWTCIGCPPGKKDQPCEAKKLGKTEMVRGICAAEYTCVEKKAELAEVAEKAEETAKDCYGYGNCEGWGTVHCLDDETLVNLESTECSQSKCCSRPEGPEEFTKLVGKSCSKSKLGPRFDTESRARTQCKAEGANCKGYYVSGCNFEKSGRIFKLCSAEKEYSDSSTSCVFDKIV